MMARGSRDRMAETGRTWSPGLEGDDVNVRVNSSLDNDIKSSNTDMANNFGQCNFFSCFQLFLLVFRFFFFEFCFFFIPFSFLFRCVLASL